MNALRKLPSIKNQTVFNLDRWEEIGRDPLVRNWPGRVETDRYGRPIMMCYAEFSHGGKQFSIGTLIQKHAPAGKVTVECPISTSEGVKVADVGWVSKKRLLLIGGRTALKGAPEICVEVISPSNKRGEIEEKRRLYFEAGAKEVWVCDKKGRLLFFIKDEPDSDAGGSLICPKMPKTVDA
jgi:Uma2 family endonuclease